MSKPLSRYALIAACSLMLPAAGCGQVTYIVQQYDGPPRAAEQVSIIRLQPDDPAQIDELDGEAMGGGPLASDARLHIEVLPGKHTLVVRNPRFGNTQRVSFVAEPGRVYRILLADRAWHARTASPDQQGAWSPLIYEVGRANDHLLREVSLPPAGS